MCYKSGFAQCEGWTTYSTHVTCRSVSFSGQILCPGAGTEVQRLPPALTVVLHCGLGCREPIHPKSCISPAPQLLTWLPEVLAGLPRCSISFFVKSFSLHFLFIDLSLRKHHSQQLLLEHPALNRIPLASR